MSPKKSFGVYATTAKEKIEWMTHISNCIEKLSTSMFISLFLFRSGMRNLSYLMLIKKALLSRETTAPARSR